MNNGVKLLLDRMDSNPEEFSNNGRWLDIYNNYKKFMTEDEQTAVTAKLRTIKMAEFEKKMVERLFRQEEKFELEEEEWNPFQAPIKCEGQTVKYVTSNRTMLTTNKVKLTQADVALANKLGVSLQDFARRKELLK